MERRRRCRQGPGRLAGKIVITPQRVHPRARLSIGHTTSVAEQIAQAAPGAKVVKSFNTLGVAM